MQIGTYADCPINIMYPMPQYGKMDHRYAHSGPEANIFHCANCSDNSFSHGTPESVNGHFHGPTKYLPQPMTIERFNQRWNSIVRLPPLFFSDWILNSKPFKWPWLFFFLFSLFFLLLLLPLHSFIHSSYVYGGTITKFGVGCHDCRK